jgi:outer membrane protein TolC
MILMGSIIAFFGASLWGCAGVSYKTEPPRVETYVVRSGIESTISTQNILLKQPAEGLSSNRIKERPLTLEACVRIALDKNPLIRVTQEGVSAAKEAVGEARAPYYPELDASAGYSRWEKHAFLPNGLARPTIPSTIGPTDDWAGGLKARYLLFDSGERRTRLRAALSGKGVAEEDFNKARQDIALDVHQSYYSFISAMREQSVAKENLTRAEDHLRLARERKAAGAVPQADVVRAQVRVADEKLALVRAENLVRISRGNLNTSMGLLVEMDIEVEDLFEEVKSPEGIDIFRAFDRAIHARPEIKAALQRVGIAQSGVDSAKSSFGPKVKAEAGYGRRDADFYPKDPDWLVGITIDLPLFTGFSRVYHLGKKKAELLREEAEVSRVIQNVRLEVWTAHSKLKEAYEAIQAAEILVKDAQESVRLTRERYAAGAGTVTDLLDAETALSRATTTRVVTEWNYFIAKASFKRATGDLIAEDNPRSL